MRALLEKPWEIVLFKVSSVSSPQCVGKLVYLKTRLKQVNLATNCTLTMTVIIHQIIPRRKSLLERASLHKRCLLVNVSRSHYLYYTWALCAINCGRCVQSKSLGLLKDAWVGFGQTCKKHLWGCLLGDREPFSFCQWKGQDVSSTPLSFSNLSHSFDKKDDF